METVKQRNYKIDNIKAILIFLVVFGHMMELFSARKIYLIVYSFHMPAFIFVTGYYARFRPRKILLELIMPYVLFQTLYQFFDRYILNNTTDEFVLQYTTPYWLIWYLFAIIIYYILLPVIKTDNTKRKLQIVMLSFAISLLAGYDNTIGYYMSLSRTLVFLPFFVLGNYIGDENIEHFILKKRHGKAVLLFGVIVSSYYIMTCHVSAGMLYGSYSYEKAGFGLPKRALLFIISIIWILALFHFIPNIKIPIFTDLGKGTFSIFLLHGFCIRLIGKRGFFGSDLQSNLILALALSAAIVLVFGNRYFSKVFDYVVRGRLIKEKRESADKKIKSDENGMRRSLV